MSLKGLINFFNLDGMDEEDEFELTHVETCMGPVTKDYSFSFEWED